jgi:ADP-ribosyl-[dinitrogen reductase] hydrolase
MNTKPIPSRLERYLGCMVGLACGDAVGTTVEFSARGSFAPVTDMVGGGPFGLKAGQWTDDTSMALCLAESLLTKGFDAHDQMTRYANWWKWGYLSSTGHCFDIGMTVRAALRAFLETGDPYSGSSDPYSAGNGSLMRLAPVVLHAYPDFATALRLAADSSRTTHGASEAIESCQLFAALLYRVLHGVDKSALLVDLPFTPQEPKIVALKAGRFLDKPESEIEGSGYCVASLEAALWCFYRTGNFRDAVLRAANLGDDADTTGAIVGQIAGAYYGVVGIPPSWRERLAMSADIEDMAIKLCKN